MYTIKISDFSKQAASKMAGEQFASLMEPLIEKHEKFCVDFDGITRFASPFFNYSFAKLALKYGFDNIKNIDIRNISDTGREAYDASFDNAMLLSKNPEYSSKISTIINSNVPKKDNWLWKIL